MVYFPTPLITPMSISGPLHLANATQVASLLLLCFFFNMGIPMLGAMDRSLGIKT